MTEPLQEEVAVQDDRTESEGPGIYEIVETGILGVAFAIIYAFGILRFASSITQIWGRTAAICSSVFAVVIAMAFIHSITRIIIKSKNKDDHTA